MKKITYGLIIITIMLFLGLGFFQRPLLANTENGAEGIKDSPLNITTVNKNQYFMVKSIVLDKHNIEYLSDNEKEIYDFKYNEDIINNISKRDLFIYSGTNNEPWINEFIGKLKKGDLGIINMSRGIKTLNYEKNGVVSENPYYWLGINEYKIALYNIKSAIQEKDPKNKNYYEENYINAISYIEECIKDIKIELEKYKDYTILTNTNTFDYLLKDLGLTKIMIEEEITRSILLEKNLDENKIIFIKEKNIMENPRKIESKIDNEKLEEKLDENLDESENLLKEEQTDKLSDITELELSKPLDVKEVELVRWDEEKTLTELFISNIKLVMETLEKLPIDK